MTDNTQSIGDSKVNQNLDKNERYDKYRGLVQNSNNFERQWNKYLDSFGKTDSGLLYFKEQTPVPYQPPKKVETKENEIYINNAGLVLLWVYLGYFFKDLQLIDKGKFVSEEAQHRAVHLLQYAATERENVAENLLPLNKILCGMPFDEPIERDIVLTQKEKEATQKLIASAIKNWTALKSTSPDGYRGAFILREGRLTYSHEGWKLLVTQRTYDVLLNYLPYGISLIRQAWMTDNLWVEWV